MLSFQAGLAGGAEVCRTWGDYMYLCRVSFWYSTYREHGICKQFFNFPSGKDTKDEMVE
jgi:hypothetical protein